MKRSLYILLALILLEACTTDKPQQETSQAADAAQAPAELQAVELSPQQIEEMGIQFTQAVRQEVSEWVEVSGQVMPPPESIIQVSARIPGYVRRLQLIEGQHVQKGQVLFYIESLDFVDMQRRYLTVLADLEQLESAYKREQALLELDVNARKTFEQTNAAYRKTLAEKKALEAQLELLGVNPVQIAQGSLQKWLPVRAGRAAVVTKILTTEGAYVQPQQAVLELLDERHVHIELTVFEKDLPKVRRGQKVRLVSAAAPNDTLHAKVFEVNAKLNTDRSTNVHAHFDKAPEHPVAGSYVQAWIAVAPRVAWVLPEEAVVYDNGQAYVWRKQGKQLEPLVVQSVPASGGSVALQEPLPFSPQDSIVSTGAFRLLAIFRNAAEEE
ncbi:efflux RND transporter periplasmic adaptor subunit [Thermonema rossianum]|uniref:efflux RND transporter periplasmic adaptor subunit n=1 Tax=Thermonema rossianum TaxID=55505 RepID=UPI00056DFB98|nr:efflux RND transporter periplasmic adaptor subunit [Thermonema rossianum]